jgi:cyclic beta-1,2-glucan synthetase
VQRASNLAHTMAGIRVHETQIDADSWRALLRLQTLLASQAARELPPAQRTGVPQTHCNRRVLWRHGISGERPLLVVQIADEGGVPLVQLLKKALRLWSAAGLGVDLVVVNAEPASYLTPVQRQLQMLRERHLAQQDERWPAAQRSAMHVLREADLAADERAVLYALARVRLSADGRTLAQQIGRLLDELQRDAAGVPRPTPTRLPVATGTPGGEASQPPEGRFDPDDGSYHFETDGRRRPSRPWINVLANPDFGCHVSEVGAGMTWAGNSRMHQLTPWSNDPLGDPAGEWLLLHDLDRPQVWVLGRSGADGSTEVTHGIGFTRIRHRVSGVEVTLTWCVDAEEAVKQVQVSLHNQSGRPRRLRLVAFVEWQLASARFERQTVATRAERMPAGPHGVGLPEPPQRTVLQATQLDDTGGFGGATAFLAWRTERAVGDDWTCDRREFFDPGGALVLPVALGRRSGLGLDPCGAIGCMLALPSGGAMAATLLLGHAPSAAAATAVAARALVTEPAHRLQRQRERWRRLAGTVRVATPDPLFDALVNHWLPYQTVACRLWARAGFYQAGGAFGFRDQLQDAMNLVAHAPQMLAQQIRLHAARQFPEGDVQHWWHQPGGAGVRTHFADDLLWLPLAVALYDERTGDHRLLDESAPFLAGSVVPPGREDVYETPQVGLEWASIYEHAARAIDRSLATGRHGLPLMGTGDWNDGMNRVGHAGRGESVWMGWFLCEVVRSFTPVAEARGDLARVAAWRTAREGWVRALEDAGWDGAWYRRAFFDDGSPLGSNRNAECRIDLIAQAWAVLSGAGDPVRARQAMASADALLYDEAPALQRLLAPPLQAAQPSAGYIQAYPPGVRENGGQYSHAAVWALMAHARLGDAGAAWRLYCAVSPAHRWQNAASGAAYALEPFAVAADIYAVEPYAGRGGWSWYTGAAGWLLRAALESICGVVVARGSVRVTPALPPHWSDATVCLSIDGREHRIVVCQDDTALQAALLRTPTAERHPAGATIPLAGRSADSVIVIDAVPGSAERGARQQHLEERPFAVFRAPDE